MLDFPNKLTEKFISFSIFSKFNYQFTNSSFIKLTNNGLRYSLFISYIYQLTGLKKQQIITNKFVRCAKMGI